MSNPRVDRFQGGRAAAVLVHKVAEISVIGNGVRAAPAPFRPHPRPRRRAVAVPADAAAK